MKTWIKASGLAVLAIAAAITAWSAVSNIVGNTEPSTQEIVNAGYNYEPSCGIEDAEYILRATDGYISVFATSEAKTPITVTNIELRSLREVDRAVIEQGMAVSDREELMSLLEDFGS